MAQSAIISGDRASSGPATRLRVLVTMAEVGLLASLAFVAAKFVWLIAFGASAGSYDAGSVDDRARSDASSSYVADLNALRHADLFADRRTSAEPVVVAAQAPETELNLALRGIRMGQNATTGAAIIQTPDNRQQFYAVGSQIMDGVTLEAVQVDHVIIRRRGIAESLYLRETDVRPAAASPRPATSLRQTGESAGPAALPGFELSELFQVRPAVENGRLVGYRFTGNNAVVLEAVGLRAGDVVTAVNGYSLRDVSDLNGLFEEIEEEENAVSLSILRNGLALNLQVDLP